MQHGSLGGQDVVDTRVRQAAGAHDVTKARTQEMVHSFVCVGGLVRIAREEAAHTLTSAEPG